MAVPPLPADVTTGGVTSAAHQNSILDLLAFFRDDRPAFYGRSTIDVGVGQESTSGVDEKLHFDDGFGAVPAPVVNVGGWTSDIADQGIVVPETGLYEISARVSFVGNATGMRLAWLLDTSAEIDGSRVQQANNGSASSATQISTATSLRFLTASTDKIGVSVRQNSGTILVVHGWLTARWVGSSAS